ncbi:MarR family transcriptional regulator [Komarekiella sp. 'clone 1']|uniref:MarR family transcriptional regulator n=1 Tax=Komarekiella delphini-convector SJRDD-AB1 TaxID=2593771 RepID=A0AA40T332_9NOST|nr:MarR family transcriptional regulator [Komarekiella delphini-convector]MBD6619749.1 MarR family transcriptional regulator [Komarekiella delphini-convector SJRDD-AB1]
MTKLDRVPVAQLPDKYGIVKSVLYDRINRLGIKPTKIGNKSYVSGEQLELLDQLDAHMKAGGSMANFADQYASQSGSQYEHFDSGIESASQSDGQLTVTGLTASQLGQLPQLIEGLVTRLIPAIVRQLPGLASDPVAHLRALEEAYKNGWLLSTRELATLLKLSPATVRGYGTQFDDAGFVFTRAGVRKGGEVAWSIGKPKKFK